jgi:hypothetical protein
VEALEERNLLSAYSDTIVADGPLGYWRLGESDPSQPAMDSSGNGNDGAYMGGVTLGKPGAIANDDDTAAGFDGATGFVDIPSMGTFDLNNQFSLEAWVINSGQQLQQAGRIFSNGGFAWGILTGGGTFTKDAVRFTTFSHMDYDSNLTIVPEDGSWHYLAVTLDDTNTATFYLDGVQTDSIPGPAPAFSSGLDLFIGKNPYQNAPEYFNGCIDEPAVYPYVLSPDQITNHYNVGIGGSAPHHGSGPHATFGHDLNQSVFTTLPPTTLGQDLGSTPSGQLQQVGLGQQPATVDQLFGSLPATSQRTSDAQVSLPTPAQHQHADPFTLETSLASDMTTI